MQTEVHGFAGNPNATKAAFTRLPKTFLFARY